MTAIYLPSLASLHNGLSGDRLQSSLKLWDIRHNHDPGGQWKLRNASTGRSSCLAVASELFSAAKSRVCFIKSAYDGAVYKAWRII
jgi:hypothetical protein